MRTRWASVLTIGLVCFCLAPRRAEAQYPPELQQQMWSAQWITHPDAPQRDAVVLRFRKIIDLPQKPEHFIVHVSADNQFQFYVNQQWVGFGPARADLAHWRYETYDIAPFFIRAKTFWRRPSGISACLRRFRKSATARRSFFMETRHAERAADTNDSWEVEQEKGIHVRSQLRNRCAENTTSPSPPNSWTAQSSTGNGIPTPLHPRLGKAATFGVCIFTRRCVAER